VTKTLPKHLFVQWHQSDDDRHYLVADIEAEQALKNGGECVGVYGLIRVLRLEASETIEESR